jgi:hypothetical protein
MTYAGDLLRSGQGYSVSSADQIVMLCRLIARPDRIGFSAPKVEQAIDARREVTNGLLIPRRETRSGSRPAGASVRPNGSVGGPTARMWTSTGRAGGSRPLKPVAHRDARKYAVSRMGLKTTAIS